MSWMAIARKDLLAEARGRETLVPVLLTALLAALVALLALHDVADRAAAFAAVVWTSLAFAAALGLARAFGAETDEGTLDTLLALPVERTSLMLGKLAATFTVVLLAAMVVVPLQLVATGDASFPPALLAILVLGALGLALAGTMLSVLAAKTRTRDAMLPVLMLPLLVPLLLAALHGTMDVLRGEPFAAWRPELLTLAGYDLALGAACALLFEEAVTA